MMQYTIRAALLGGAALLLAGPAAAADPATIDWSKIPTATVALFYPGQSSYEWLRSPEHKKAQKETIEGQACIACHKGEEKTLGAKLVKEGDLESAPVKDKVGSIDLGVQVAYDATNAYFRLRWKTQANGPGIEYPYYRFDGKAWKQYGFPRLDDVVREGQQPGIYEDRFSMMIDDGKVPMFAQQGCWLSCHNSNRDMPDVASKEDALKYLKRDDVRKYLPGSRNTEEWSSVKSPEELAKLKADGMFVDLVQWRAHRTNPVGGADDGYVLEWRLFDAGRNNFGSNMDGNTKQPRFMFDAAKFGSKSVSADQIRKKENFLIQGTNAVPFDPNAGWKEGDLLPRYFLQQAQGSAADNKGKGEWKDGYWTVVMVRPLNLTNADDKALKPGSVYNIGFAVHDDNITTRGHQVSFVRSVGFGAKADIEATKLQ